MVRALDRFLNEYYHLRKWTETGIPTREKLEELGLGYVVKDMKKKKKKKKKKKIKRQGGMDLGLGDKVALVTGAGSQIGYGRAISFMLAQEGCDIVAADIDLAGAEKTAAEVNALLVARASP